ncbi:hypothetical protein B7486_10225 [cyanobacterium TDX16]|nr:hypothetical protein B7486_10225 [cyanobacterium TDX16]
MTESELVKRCRIGDRDAQHEFYNQTSDRIYRLCLRMTQSQDVAFDLAQEAYLKAFSRMSQFNGESSLASWLYRIAVNEVLQFLRRKGPMRLGGNANLAAQKESESELQGKDVALDVAEALASLDPPDRAMLLLRYQEGLDYREIAGVMGCPAGTVASRLHRARQRARQFLVGGYDLTEENPAVRHQRVGAKVVDTSGPEAEPLRKETGLP